MENKIANITACSSVMSCLAGWATSTLPILEWLAYFVGFISGCISLWMHIKKKMKENE